MKKLTIQLKDIDGNVTEEKEVNVSDSELLVISYEIS